MENHVICTDCNGEGIITNHDDPTGKYPHRDCGKCRGKGEVPRLVTRFDQLFEDAPEDDLPF